MSLDFLFFAADQIVFEEDIPYWPTIGCQRQKDPLGRGFFWIRLRTKIHDQIISYDHIHYDHNTAHLALPKLLESMHGEIALVIDRLTCVFAKINKDAHV